MNLYPNERYAESLDRAMLQKWGVDPLWGVVVLLSGGIDSAVMLWGLRGVAHRAISINYGQHHSKELIAAAKLARRAGVEHDVIHIPAVGALFPQNALTGSSDTLNGASTIVPNRNMILLSIAAGVAIADGVRSVAYAAHAGDRITYPDCRPEFADAVAAALALDGVRLLRPFIDMRKEQIIKDGQTLSVPLGLTWSCYRSGLTHCGTCGACVERRRGFLTAGVTDLTEYSA